MKLHFLALISFVLFFTSCKKEGCTDARATNYDSEANTNDDSCEYSADMVFWFDETSSDELVNAGVTEVRLEINGFTINQNDPDVYWNTVPTCGHLGTLSYTFGLGQEARASVNYKVKDQNEEDIWSGILDIEGGLCTSLQLVW